MPAHSTRDLMCAALVACAAVGPTQARAEGNAPAAQPAQDDTLWRELGAQPGIDRLAQDLVRRMTSDARTAPFFKDTELKRLRKTLAEQLCVVSGGPCHYSGDDMREVHKGLPITVGDFNAVVELLQDALDAQSVPFASQNRLLARLAPMYRDIITR